MFVFQCIEDSGGPHTDTKTNRGFVLLIGSLVNVVSLCLIGLADSSLPSTSVVQKVLKAHQPSAPLGGCDDVTF